MKITEIVEEEILEERVIMGGDLNRLEPMKMEDFSKRQATWIMLKEGGFVPYMQVVASYDENCSQKFIYSRKDRRVTINGITFQVNEESISMLTGLEISGRKWKKVTKVVNEASLAIFFRGNEALDRYHGGLRRDKLSEPWDDVCLIIMKYLTLKGRHGVYYFYHFPLLNHFRNREFICIMFFLMHALEETVMDVREKKKKETNFTTKG